MTVTDAVAHPASLVEWDYWLNTWPDAPVVLTRANAADGYPKALTPLSQDLVIRFEEAGVRRFYFESLGALRPGDCPTPFMQAYYGLVYLNADQMGDLGDATPGSSRFGVFQSILGLEPDPAFVPPKPSLADRLREVRAAARVVPRVLRFARTAAARIDRQVAEVRAAQPPSPDDLDRTTAAAWLARLEALQTPAWESLMIGAASGIAFYETAQKAVVSALRETGADLTNRLHVGLGGNESAEAGIAVQRLADRARASAGVVAALEQRASVDDVRAADAGFAADLDRVVERFGHRAPAELELANNSWRADPSQLLDIVRIELRRPSHSDGATRIRTDAEAELAATVGAARRRLIGALVRRSRAVMAVRENAKIPVVRVFDATRRLLAGVAPTLVADGVVPDARWLVFLRYDELRDVLAGGAGPGQEELARRREAHARCLELDLPELAEAGPGWLRPLDGDLLASRGVLPPPATEADAERLEGIAASPGRITGTARVLLDPFEDFEPGDVLFAKTVDPGWAPVLSCAGAVVLDMGGLMSHGAVVARELGIPCVVNVRSGTIQARTGSTVTVDGSAGEVLLA